VKFASVFLITLVLEILMAMPALAGIDADYGNAPTSEYTYAAGGTDKWQRLGSGYDKENYSQTKDGISKGGAVDGIMWRSQGSENFQALKTTDSFTTGKVYELQFSLWQSGTGSHKYDYLNVWLDRDNNNEFDQDRSGFYDFFKDKGATTPDKEHIVHKRFRHKGKRRYTNITATIKFDNVGDYWMRSRVSCRDYWMNNSRTQAEYKSDWSGRYGSYWYRSNNRWCSAGAEGYTEQGEVQDYRFVVTAAPPSPVPEPGTFVLFGMGLIVASRLGRRTQK